MNAINESPCDTWFHRTNAVQRDFGASWGNTWMHHDGQIEDPTTEIKEDRGPYDVGSCPLFTSGVDASGASNPHRTIKNDEIMGCGIVAHGRRTIIAVDWSSPNRTTRVSRENYSLKTDAFSSFTQLLIESRSN